METIAMPKERKITPVHIPYGEMMGRHLHVAVGACKLRIVPGAGGEGEVWVGGTYNDPTGAMPLEVNRAGGEIKISQSYSWAELAHMFDGPAVLELTLGKAMPFSLSIETGASETYLDLGGLPLTDFRLRQGAGKVVVDFSAPNRAHIERMEVSSGASAIEMFNLANAGFRNMSIEGGAASYRLDFGGALQREAAVKLSAAMSSTDITVPRATAARIASKAMMGGLNVGDGFMKKDGAFWTEAALAGLQPTLFIQVELMMGSLELHTK